MSDYLNARALLITTIQTVLTERPELAGEASQAINTGVSLAVQQQNKELAQVRHALALSLALLPPNRITENAKSHLETLIVQALPTNAQTKSERTFVERVRS